MVDRPLTPAQVADRYQVARETVYLWVKAGRFGTDGIHFFRLGIGARPEYRFRPSALEFFEGHQWASQDSGDKVAESGPSSGRSAPTPVDGSRDAFRAGQRTATRPSNSSPGSKPGAQVLPLQRRQPSP